MKKETFINRLVTYYNGIVKPKLLSPINKLKTFHEWLKSHNLKKYEEIPFISPYTAVSGWLLDVAVNGLLLAIIYAYFNNLGLLRFLVTIMVLGVLRYVIIDFVIEIRKAIKGE